MHWQGIFLRRNCQNEKPYFAQISYDGSSFHKETDINLFVEPGNIYIRMVDWDTDANVSGTSINEDYNTTFLSEKLNGVLYIGIEIGEKWRKIVLKQRIVTY